MLGTRTPTTRESQDAPAFVYSRESRDFKRQARTWSAPGPMVSLQHAERKELVSAAPEFDDEDFRACWWPGESWDWE